MTLYEEVLKHDFDSSQFEIDRINNQPYLGWDDTVYDEISIKSAKALEERRKELEAERIEEMDLYCEKKYGKYPYKEEAQKVLNKDLRSKFIIDCANTPYLQQCKVYDC